MEKTLLLQLNTTGRVPEYSMIKSIVSFPSGVFSCTSLSGEYRMLKELVTCAAGFDALCFPDPGDAGYLSACLKQYALPDITESIPRTAPENAFPDAEMQVTGQEAVFSASGFSFRIPLYTGTLKYFFADYKNYYYLTDEDCACHKSLAQFKDRSFRIPAKRETCYIKKTGSFLPVSGPFPKNVFYQNYGSEPAYALPEDIDPSSYICGFLMSQRI